MEPTVTPFVSASQLSSFWAERDARYAISKRRLTDDERREVIAQRRREAETLVGPHRVAALTELSQWREPRPVR